MSVWGPAVCNFLFILQFLQTSAGILCNLSTSHPSPLAKGPRLMARCRRQPFPRGESGQAAHPARWGRGEAAQRGRPPGRKGPAERGSALGSPWKGCRADRVAVKHIRLKGDSPLGAARPQDGSLHHVHVGPQRGNAHPLVQPMCVPSAWIYPQWLPQIARP